MIFMIKMQDFHTKKCIGNDFYYKNAAERIFAIKYIRNYFYYKNALKNILL